MKSIYEIIQQNGISVSKKTFSQHYCQMRSANYFAMSPIISETAGLNVVRRLWAEGRWLLAIRILLIVVKKPSAL